MRHIIPGEWMTDNRNRQQQPRNPERYDRELERTENRRECPRCHKFSLVDYVFEKPQGLHCFCLECGYKE